MKAVILCGGQGARLRELTEDIPKPLIEIGDKPVLWHIMKIYASHGINQFILCLGYKGEKIKEYFDKNNGENWNIEFVDTGIGVSKAERLLKIRHLIDEDTFLVSYGDDVSDVNIKEVIDFHNSKGKIATLTAIKPRNPFGVIDFQDGIVKGFKEKPVMSEWINGGYFVFNKKIFDYMEVEEDLEKEVFAKLVKEGELCGFKHPGFWEGMNTLKDVQELNSLWKNGKASWKVW